MVEHPSDRGQGLVDTFRASLPAKYAFGQHPSPPVGQIWGSHASSSGDSHGGSSSSVDELFGDDESANVADRGGLIEEGSQAPPVHVLLVEQGVATAVAGVTACADEVVAGCLLNGFYMEPLF